MPGPIWTAQEKKLLRRQVRREKRALSDVEIPGRSVNAVRATCARMGLIEKRASRARWSEKQKRRLKQLKQQGFLPQEIYDYQLLGEPNRSKWSITKQWGRMKLADHRRSQKMKNKKQWRLGERDRFQRYLLRHSKSQTPEQIAKVWSVARSTVSRWQHQLGVKATREQVLQMEFSRAKQRAARKRIQQASRSMWRRRIQQREQSLLSLAAQLRAGGRRPPEQTCTDCGKSWPRRREFFPHHEKKISIGTSRYFKHRCILCENLRRRKQARKSRSPAANRRR